MQVNIYTNIQFHYKVLLKPHSIAGRNRQKRREKTNERLSIYRVYNFSDCNQSAQYSIQKMLNFSLETPSSRGNRDNPDPFLNI